MTLETGVIPTCGWPTCPCPACIAGHCVQGGLPHQGHYQTERRWAGHCGSKPLHRMQMCLNACLLESLNSARMERCRSATSASNAWNRDYPCLHECLSARALHAGPAEELSELATERQPSSLSEQRSSFSFERRVPQRVPGRGSYHVPDRDKNAGRRPGKYLGSSWDSPLRPFSSRSNHRSSPG